MNLTPLLSLLALLALPPAAEVPTGAPSRFYAEVNAGPAFATFLPIEGGTEGEHLVTSGTNLMAEIGHGWEWPSLRLDAGVRLQHMRLGVVGKYSPQGRDDAFRATYDYLAPLLAARVVTRREGAVNLFAGLALGTATFFSDRQGSELRLRQIPFYGSFDAGLQVRLTPWLEGNAGLSWQPPVSNLNVLSPRLGIRARF